MTVAAFALAGLDVYAKPNGETRLYLVSIDRVTGGVEAAGIARWEPGGVLTPYLAGTAQYRLPVGSTSWEELVRRLEAVRAYFSGGQPFPPALGIVLRDDTTSP